MWPYLTCFVVKPTPNHPRDDREGDNTCRIDLDRNLRRFALELTQASKVLCAKLHMDEDRADFSYVVSSGGEN